MFTTDGNTLSTASATAYRPSTGAYFPVARGDSSMLITGRTGCASACVAVRAPNMSVARPNALRERLVAWRDCHPGEEQAELRDAAGADAKVYVEVVLNAHERCQGKARPLRDDMHRPYILRVPLGNRIYQRKGVTRRRQRKKLRRIW